MGYAEPNPHSNSIRGGVLTNLPPDNGDPDKPHAPDKTCLCEKCSEWRMSHPMSETAKITNARLREIIKEELGQNREKNPDWHQGPARGEDDEGMWYCRVHGISWPSDNRGGCPKCKAADRVNEQAGCNCKRCQLEQEIQDAREDKTLSAGERTELIQDLRADLSRAPKCPKGLNEQVDHAGMSAVVSSASKLLAAVEGFKEKASAHAINALTPGLSDLEKTLENMVSNPGSYVVKPKPKPQRVSLRAVKGEARAIMKGLKEVRTGQHVRIQGSLADPFAGQTGYVRGFEMDGRTKMYRVRLDNPVDVPGVGLVTDDLWAGHLLKVLREGDVPVKKTLKEATGDEGYERVKGNSWQHLEVGNEYSYKDGNHHGVAGFVGWVDKSGEHTESEDPTEVNLKFVDTADGDEWEAYWFDDGYVTGSSADALYVANPHYEDDVAAEEAEADYGEPGDYRRDT